MNIKSQNLSELLKAYIKQQTEKNSKLSESQISQQLDIPNPTINRILNRKTEPSVKTLIKLSKFIPEIKKFLPSEMFDVVFDKTNGEVFGEKLEKLLNDEEMFLIYTKAFSKNGITENFIIRHFGSDKLKKLELLKKEGFVKREGNGLGVYKVTKDRQFTSSFELIKKHIDMLNKFYDAKESKRNYAFYGINALNGKGIESLMIETKKYHAKVADIIEKEDNQGETLVFATGVSDILFEESFNKSGENKL